MHPPSVRAAALELITAGVNDCEISRRLGVPRRTVLDWRRPSYAPKNPIERCPRCWKAAKPMRFTPGDYAELLGLYLGDGCISQGARTSRLRITLDVRYQGIIRETCSLLARCFPHNSVDVVRRTDAKCVNVSVYSLHLPCLFPQDGDGAKHTRSIVLEAWQWNLVEQVPWRFLRGCIRSDGCVFINRTGRYEYLSYQFSNSSEDIVRIFTATCDLVDLAPRVTVHDGKWSVRLNRRGDVARLVEHVGLKA